MNQKQITKDVLPDLRKTRGHKYDHGHALVLSGGPRQTGAARLAARGALRVGAGLVTMGVPTEATQEVATQITALMMTPISEPEDLAKTLQDNRISAICIGPGLGLSKDKSVLIDTALNSDRALVLDADALTHLSKEKHLFSALHDRCVLTPHQGEFTRLFPYIAERLAKRMSTGQGFTSAAAAIDAATNSGAVIVLKGQETFVAHPDGRCSRHAATGERLTPWLATAGSGDVLSGFITGLIARGLAPFTAAETAVWLHVECARRFGPGLIAEDLPEILPAVLRDL